DDRRLILSLPRGWLQTHPLSARSLDLERHQLGRLGLKLVLATLAEPHPVQPRDTSEKSSW
ncbi:MAG: hypothetical protein WDZ60_03765, partial [Wenzhouxiangellaceae bacterium]